MSNTDFAPDDVGAPEAGPPGPGAGGAPAAPPPGGGPFLAALARQNMGPPVSSPGPGNMAQGMTQVGMAHALLTKALANFPAGSPQWKDVHRALGMLGKHMASGAPGAGVQQTELGDLLRQTLRGAITQRLMGGRGQGGQMPQQAPSPTPALPGA